MGANEQLKPCPFCGGEAILIKEKIITRFYVECKKCSAMTNLFTTKEEAIEVWNRRTNNDR